MPNFLAVDAGNSKTVALVLDDRGTVLGRGRGGRGDIYGATTVEDAHEAVASAINEALLGAGITSSDLTYSALFLAGVDWPEDETHWHEILDERFPGLGPRLIRNDAFASLRLIDGTGVGVSIGVGTGPAIAARAANGREAFSGMFVFHDLGGAGLGNSAMRAVMLESMGLAPRTSLTERLLEITGLDSPPQLRHEFTKRFGARPESDLWLASRAVLAAADEGDAVAQSIVDEQAEAFTGYAQWAAREVGVPLDSGDLPVILNGSVATSQSPAMRRAIESRIYDVAPRAKVSTASSPPITGIALDALAGGNVLLTPDVLAVVRSADHPHGFLTT